MARPSAAEGRNGFTMLESMLVLLILSVLLFVSVPLIRQTSSLFAAHSLQQMLVRTQLSALATRTSQSVDIAADRALSSSETLLFPSGTVCQSARISFNARGNVSRAGHVDCTCGSQTFRLVLQLGSGRIRIEPR